MYDKWTFGKIIQLNTALPFENAKDSETTVLITNVDNKNDFISNNNNMADWTKNNRACTTLWTTLYAMKQLSTNFNDSGDLKINDLTFYNALGSAELRKQQSTIIADQLDNVFRLGSGATFETDFDRTKAMGTMIEILTNEEKQVKDLASAVDDAYSFWGEKI
jgi:hypothetical protein